MKIHQLDNSVFAHLMNEWFDPVMLVSLKSACTNQIMANLLDQHIVSPHFRGIDHFLRQNDEGVCLEYLTWLWNWVFRLVAPIDWIIRHEILLLEDLDESRGTDFPVQVENSQLLVLSYDEHSDFQPTVEDLAMYMNSCGKPGSIRLINCNSVSYMLFRALRRELLNPLKELVLEKVVYHEMSSNVFKIIIASCPSLTKFVLRYKDREYGNHSARHPAKDESRQLIHLLNGSNLRTIKLQYHGIHSTDILTAALLLSRRAPAQLREVDFRFSPDYDYDAMAVVQVVEKCVHLRCFHIYSDICAARNLRQVFTKFEYISTVRSGKMVTLHDKSYIVAPEVMTNDIWTVAAMKALFTNVCGFTEINFHSIETTPLETIAPIIAANNALTLCRLTYTVADFLNPDHTLDTLDCVHVACINTRAINDGFIRITELGSLSFTVEEGFNAPPYPVFTGPPSDVQNSDSSYEYESESDDE